jgi:hypothetical protein
MRTGQNPYMDNIAYGLNYNDFNMLWLGGDLADQTTENTQSMDHLNQYFSFGNPSTLWALGNHDYLDTNIVTQYTGRNTFYAYHRDGITYLVLDTQRDDCSVVGDQKTLFDNVTDTISSSSHLVILHHKLIWLYDHPILNPDLEDISNGPLGSCHYCLEPNNFMSDLYPILTNVQQHGIQVICVGGDLGIKRNEFEYLDTSGMYFLASGINDGTDDDQVLVFTHDIEKRELKWNFIPLW